MKTVKIKNSNKKIPVGKIVCVGRNYAAHAKEMGNEIGGFPVIFLKAASFIIYSGEKIIHPAYSNNLHHEVELVLLIGKNIKNADDENAENVIAGYGVGLDMTLRDLQHEYSKKGEPWTLAKGFDTSAVLSDFILKENYRLKGNEKIFLSVNGIERQYSSLDKLLFNPVEIVKYVSSKMTLEEGDIIFTGTPEGVGKVMPGDKIFAGIENIGELTTEIQ